MKKNVFFVTILFVALISQSAKPQNTQEPFYEEFKSAFNKQYLNVGLLIQVVGDYQYERIISTNGFNISNARLKLYGEFDKNIGYFLQTSFIKSPAILDAKIYYKLTEAVVFNAGLFKAPFSREFLTSAADIDFVNRSIVVSNLAPNRQIGFQVGGVISALNLNYSLGVFNGNRFTDNSNDNNRFMYAARLAYLPKVEEVKTEIAFNIAQSSDERAYIPPISPEFTGDRLIVGADTRITFKDFLLSGEVIYANLKPNFGSEQEAFGYQGTLGYSIITNLQALLRWESYSADKNLNSDNQVVLGLNFWPSKISELQLNYVIPTNLPIKNFQILINTQVSI